MRLNFLFYKPEHAELLVDWLCSDTWPFHGSMRPEPDEVRGWIEAGRVASDRTRSAWIVEEQGERIGLIRIHDLQDVTPTFDLRVRSAHRGKGVGRAALDWLARYLFTQTDKLRVEGTTRVDNLAMRRVFQARGWVKEGHYRQAWPDQEGVYRDAVGYALLRQDWQTGRSTPVPLFDEVDPIYARATTSS